MEEERRKTAQLAAERDNADKAARQNETKVLSLNNQLEELEDRLAESERQKKALQTELMDLVESKDDVGKKMRYFAKIFARP